MTPAEESAARECVAVLAELVWINASDEMPTFEIKLELDTTWERAATALAAMKEAGK
jgi:hypothetical protein